MAETETRYTRKKKKKSKRWGFGLNLWEPKEAQEDQQRLLHPRQPPVHPPSRSNGQETVPRLRRYVTLDPADRALMEEVRDVTKRTLGDDSVRLDALVAQLNAAGFEVEWTDETETIPGHWKVSHPDFAETPQEDDEEGSEVEENDQDDPVVREEPPQ
jgi:hypothetical protein